MLTALIPFVKCFDVCRRGVLCKGLLAIMRVFKTKLNASALCWAGVNVLSTLCDQAVDYIGSGFVIRALSVTKPLLSLSDKQQSYFKMVAKCVYLKMVVPSMAQTIVWQVFNCFPLKPTFIAWKTLLDKCQFLP